MAMLSEYGACWMSGTWSAASPTPAWASPTPAWASPTPACGPDGAAAHQAGHRQEEQAQEGQNPV